MKTFIVTLLLIVCAVMSSAQSEREVPWVSNYIPSTLTAGTLMSGRTAATTLLDTTRAFNSRGYAAIYVGIETAVNDTIDPIIVSYQYSKDGASWSTFTVVDSLNANGIVGLSKYIPLPANALGAYQCRVRVAGRAGGSYSGPAATVTTKILRVLHSAAKLK